MKPEITESIESAAGINRAVNPNPAAKLAVEGALAALALGLGLYARGQKRVVGTLVKSVEKAGTEDLKQEIKHKSRLDHTETKINNAIRDNT